MPDMTRLLQEVQAEYDLAAREYERLHRQYERLAAEAAELKQERAELLARLHDRPLPAAVDPVIADFALA